MMVTVMYRKLTVSPPLIEAIHPGPLLLSSSPQTAGLVNMKLTTGVSFLSALFHFSQYIFKSYTMQLRHRIKQCAYPVINHILYVCVYAQLYMHEQLEYSIV